MQERKSLYLFLSLLRERLEHVLQQNEESTKKDRHGIEETISNTGKSRIASCGPRKHQVHIQVGKRTLGGRKKSLSELLVIWKIPWNI